VPVVPPEPLVPLPLSGADDPEVPVRLAVPTELELCESVELTELEVGVVLVVAS
jgi:hypothetical protein